MKIRSRKYIVIGLIILSTFLYVFRNFIFQNDFSQAKLKIFKTLLTDTPDTAWQNTRIIVDSTLIKYKLKE